MKIRNLTRNIAKFTLVPIALWFLLVGYISRPETTKTLKVVKPIFVTSPHPPETKGDFYVYLSEIANRESNNTPTAVNRIGMLGKYQFSPRTLWE